MVEWIVFVIVSAVVVYFSWPSFRGRRRSHGFYRFFAFESILGIVLLNARVWFFDPFTVRQLISWLLLIASLFLAGHGFRLLQRIGQPKGQKGTIEGFESTTQLVTVGAYHYIRHPMYSSLLCLGWGAFLKGTNLLTLVLVMVCTAALVATAKAEESENLAHFGEKYTRYMQRTKMFIPYLF